METPEHLKSEESTPELNRAKQLIQLIQPITGRVAGVVSRVKKLSWIYLGSALVLWGCMLLPFSIEGAWSYVFAAFLLVVLSVPAGILLLFYAGLQSVIALPARLLEKAGVGEASARSVVQSIRASGLDSADSSKTKLLSTFVELRGR